MPATTAPEQRRRQILDAAIRVFARGGYHTSRVGDIAEEAGVAYGLVYHYFDSKEEVLRNIFVETWTGMLQTIEEIEAGEESAREQLRKVIELVLRTWRRDPDLVRVLVREVTRAPQLSEEIEEIEHAFQALQRIVERGQQRGEFRADLDPRLASWILYGSLEEILTGWVLGRLEADDESIATAERTVLELLSDGLSTRS
ncbi:MAG: TetR family transcriptional regulator [Actinomycetota bacterium]|nr:TetR family transcriptional regulator [Actinomycetota bacterium]